jgi:MFS-type transporter involved in bile tolerance (Atg22 family)
MSMGLYRCFDDIGIIILGSISDNYGLRMPFYAMTAIVLVSGKIAVFAKEVYRLRLRKRVEREIRD